MDNGLWINTENANSLGIKNGDNVVVESPYGKITAQASLTDKSELILSRFAHGRGYLNPSTDTWARKGVNENPLTRTATRPGSYRLVSKQRRTMGCLQVYGLHSQDFEGAELSDIE